MEEIIGRPPEIHGPGTRWGLSPAALRWLAARLRPGMPTLETGCGLSSIVFAAAQTRHTVVAPDAREHERVRAWCQARGIATDGITWVAEHSQRALPRLPPEPLELALIDGGHAFPTPFIDWFYIAERLQAGGVVMIDDVDLRAPRLLRDFLAAEGGRWATEPGVERAAVFRKIAPDVIPHDDWVGQAWSRRGAGGRLRRALPAPVRAVARRARDAMAESRR